MAEVLAKRYGEIDLLKGFGILMMIVGHIPVNRYFVHFIYIFHMPLFFLVSGFLYRNKNAPMKDVALAYVKKLLHPYFFFGIMGLSLLLLETKAPLYESLKNSLVAIFFFNTDNMPVAGALWYLTSILFVYLLFFFFRRFARNECVFSVGVWLLFLLGLFWSKVTDVRLPWAMDVAFVGLGFYYLGFLYAKYKERIDLLLKENKFFACLLCCCCVLSGMMNDKVSMRSCSYGNEFCFVACAVALTLFFYKIACAAAAKKGVFWDTVKEIGQRSIFFLCTNEIVINITNSVFSKVGMSGTLLMCCKLFGSLFLLLLMEKVVYNSTKVKSIIGV